MAWILAIDDEPSICWGLAELGKRMGHKVVSASTAEKGLEVVRRQPPDLILLDVRLPGMDGLAALPLLNREAPGAPIVVMTAHGELSTAVEAVRQGAFDYVAKPFDLVQIERVIALALAEPAAAASPVAIEGGADGLVGRTPAMQEVFKRIALVAPSNACVMLSGESGSGKEVVARAIHRYSRRSGGPFVAVNVAALNPNLTESELFGHVRAHSPAPMTARGLLAEADGGTLFLDEVAEVPLPVQVKLLRALEQGEVQPVGSGQTVKTSFRLVSASHQDLTSQVQAGEFRHDLYYRLSTFRIDLPPLRERRDDIPALVDYFVRALAAGDPHRPVKISHEALAEMQSRQWLGNVRELRNAIEHALIVARDGEILAEHLPPVRDLSTPKSKVFPDISLPDTLAELVRKWTDRRLSVADQPASLYDEFLGLVEPALLQAALQKYHGQCAAAARALGIHRTTLKKKLDQYGIAGDE